MPGGSQRGIDIVATLNDGRQRTIQCRHRMRFTKGDAKKVVEETTYDADEHEVWVTTRVGRLPHSVGGHLTMLAGATSYDPTRAPTRASPRIDRAPPVSRRRLQSPPRNGQPSVAADYRQTRPRRRAHRIRARYLAVHRQALLRRRQTELGESLAQAPELPDRHRTVTDRRHLV